MIGTIPAICIVCAPNPIAPYHFPFPKYCPSVRWVIWQLNCNATDSTEAEIMEDRCPVYVPANQTECNCTDIEQSSGIRIEHEL